CQHGYGIPWTF
nr:immunoglobulin light chain junction region [Macaca mulatta]MOV78300.1 immunoglobulin light chain junction region [Macaca mulatta]MOV78678.1 immunoglobulin light chain junction region [Macaca mulatta]MOV79906.1 immunoglobulin light chain junction region [Macaca mulatta]MOV82189.1 immunoglobulin light chain junction region [Macaca mulatta]